MIGLMIFYGMVISAVIIIWHYVKTPGESSFPVYDDDLDAWQRWDDEFK